MVSLDSYITHPEFLDYQPILEDLYPRYTHGLLLGDLNTNLLSKSARTADLKCALRVCHCR
jgi:hypothetical protein